MSHFSVRLFEEVPPEFFRVLGYESAFLYLDAIDAMATAIPSRGGGLTRNDALGIVEDILRIHPGTVVEGQTPSEFTISQKANLVLNKLISARWLEEPERSDYQREIFIDPHAETLLAALRQIAQTESAQFTGRLRNACHTLCDEQAAENITWDDIRACLANLEAGLRELKSMRKSVERLTRKQLGAANLAESVAIVYGDFSSEIANKCYRELVRAKLPEKLVAARNGLFALMDNTRVLERLQKGAMHQDKKINAGDASFLVSQILEQIETAILSVEPLTERVDARTSEFARRSRARIYYLSSVGSSRGRQISDVFRIISERYAGQRLANVDEDVGLPGLLVGDTGMVGADSLRIPPAARTVTEIEPIADDISEADKAQCLDQMANNIAYSLSVDRAHRFLDEIGCLPGQTISSADMSIRTMDDVENVVSVLLYSDTDDADYVVEVEDALTDRPTDSKAGYAIDRFEIARNERS